MFNSCKTYNSSKTYNSFRTYNSSEIIRLRPIIVFWRIIRPRRIIRLRRIIRFRRMNRLRRIIRLKRFIRQSRIIGLRRIIHRRRIIRLRRTIIHWIYDLFSDWPKAYSECWKSVPATSSSCRLYNNHVMYDSGAWFLRVIMSSSPALCQWRSKNMTSMFCFRSMCNKTIIGWGFCDIQNNQGRGRDISRSRRLRLINLAETLIILNITKKRI